MRRKDNKYEGIEKYINPAKLRAEFVPDIEDSDLGKVLVVNEEYESQWRSLKDLIENPVDPENPDEDLGIDDIKKEIEGIMIAINDLNISIKDKVDQGDFDGAILEIQMLQTTVDILQGRIDLMVSEANITGAYLPGSNELPTINWSNILNPIAPARLIGFLFEQDSGWIGNDDDGHRLMFRGEEVLAVKNELGPSGMVSNFCIDTFLRLYEGSGVIELMEGVYIRDNKGRLSISLGELTVNTEYVIGTSLTHIAINICAPVHIYQVYINGEEVECIVSSEGDYELPETLTMFRGLKGEVFNFRLYKKALTPKEIINNYKAGYKELTFTLAALVGLYDASKAETLYANFELVSASITILKDEIRLQASRLEGMSNLTTTPFKDVRYIREYQSGTSISSTESRWLEFQCFDDKEENILKDIVPTTNAKTYENLAGATDNDRDSSYASLTHGAKEDVYLQFDLGRVRGDVMFLKVWRYHQDFRSCHGIRTQVSKDGEKWITVFDGKSAGDYEEKKGGFVIPVNLGNYLDNIDFRLQSAEIKITPEAIISTVLEHERFKEYTEEEINNAITVYKVLVDREFAQVEAATGELESTMNGAFKDGIVSEAEALAINERLVTIEKEKGNILWEFEAVYKSPALKEPFKTELFRGKERYVNAFQSLKDAILTGIEDSIASPEEIELINTLTEAYKDEQAVYKGTFTEVVDAIGDEKTNSIDSKYEERCSQIEQTAKSIILSVETVSKDKVDAGQMDEAIGTAIEGYKEEVNAQMDEIISAAGDLEGVMNGAFKDGIISEAESITIKDRIVALDKEKADVDEEFRIMMLSDKIKEEAKIAVDDANDLFNKLHVELKTMITDAISDSVASSSEITAINEKTTAYTNALADYKGKYALAVDSIAAKYSEIAQVSATKAMEEMLLDYKKEINQQFVEVNGATNDLQSEMNGAFKDGVISEAEAKALKERIIAIAKEQGDIGAEYVELYANPNLKDLVVKHNLQAAKHSYDGGYEHLYQALTTGIEDALVTEEEIENINAKTETYRDLGIVYKSTMIKAIDAIGDAKAQEIDSKYEKRCSTIEQTAEDITLTVSHIIPEVVAVKKELEDYKVVVDAEFVDINNAFDDLAGSLDQAFKDGIISEVETITIKDNITSLNKEHLDVRREYEAIYNNGYLDVSVGSSLKTSFDDYTSKHNTLVSTINSIISDKKVTDAERSQLATANSNHSYSSATLKTKLLNALDNISENKVDALDGKVKRKFADIKIEIDNISLQVVNTELAVDRVNDKAITATNKANAAQSDATDAQSDADRALKEAGRVFDDVQDMASDSKVTPQEKRILLKDVNAILDEHPLILAEAKEYHVHYQTYVTYYDRFYSNVVPLFRGSSMHVTSNVTYSSFEYTFRLYYEFKQKLLNMISYEAKKLADEAQRVADIAKAEADKKPDKDEIIASINLSNEGVVIKGEKIDLRGVVNIDDLEAGRTVIKGGWIKTGYISAIDIRSCNFFGSNITGTNMLYMAPTGVASFDGQTYIRNFRCVEVHENWPDGMRGTFSCSPTAYFEKEISCRGEIYARDMGVVGRTKKAFIQVDKLGIQNSNGTHYLEVAGYQSNHVYGVDIWYSDESLKKNITPINLRTRPLIDKKIGLSFVTSIEHYLFDYKEEDRGAHVECGYVAQNLQEHNSTTVREVIQGDGTIIREPVASSIIPNVTLAIKEQQEIIEQLKQKNAALEQRLLKIELALGL